MVVELETKDRERRFEAVGITSERMTQEGCRVTSTTIVGRVDGKLVPIMMDVTLEGGPSL